MDPRYYLYSFAVDLPPLRAGVYQARYWQRLTIDGQPEPRYYQVGEELRLVVQGIVPATGAAGRVLLVLAILLSGVMLVRKLTG